MYKIREENKNIIWKKFTLDLPAYFNLTSEIPYVVGRVKQEVSLPF